jgi:3-hydroxyacyl-[acyl-carrier-protein] dehydratase
MGVTSLATGSQKEISLTFPMDIPAIERCIPHRHPFLLIDRVVAAVPHESVVALKQVSVSDPFLQGHFPGNPVMPGVLIIEAVAQATAVLGHLSTVGGLRQCYLTEIISARFRRPVVPGDTLNIEATVKKRRAPFFWFAGRCTVDGVTVAEIEISAFLK